MQAPPPAHILALLASAPEVEPEFARRRRIVLAPLRAAATRLRIYNPVRAPAAAATAARPAVPLHARVTRAFGGLRDWLIFDTAPPQPG